MLCPRCGSSANAADARFCSSCGTALAKEPPSSSNPVGESVPQPKPQRSAAKTVLLGCLGLLVVGIVVIIVVLAIIGSNNSGSENGAAPIATATVAPEPPTRIVAAFYDAISRKDFRTAWNLLSPSFQHDGSFDKFRDGYATAQSVRVSVAEVPGAPQKVRTSLDAIDLINGNAVHSHFEGWWVLTQASDGHWLLDNGHFTKIQTDTSGQTANEAPTPTPAATPLGPNQALFVAANVGDFATIKSGPILCFDSPEVMLADQQTSGDVETKVEAAARIRFLWTGSRFAITDKSDSPVYALRVRIVSGDKTGLTCWISGTLPVKYFTHLASK